MHVPNFFFREIGGCTCHYSIPKSGTDPEEFKQYSMQFVIPIKLSKNITELNTYHLSYRYSGNHVMKKKFKTLK